MNNIYDEFINIWPEESKKILKPLLSTVGVLRFPKQIDLINTIEKKPDTVIVMDSGNITEMIELMDQGFHHCVQSSRSDFAQELLASALMTIRPQAFLKDPVPFFLSGFSSSKSASTLNKSLQLPIARNSEKQSSIEKLHDFLSANRKVSNIQDLVIQVADEMISNALFSAPRDTQGQLLYQNVDRTTDVIMPTGKEAKIFCCFTEDRVILGCEDMYGSLDRTALMNHLSYVFRTSMATPNEKNAGAAFIQSCHNPNTTVTKTSPRISMMSWRSYVIRTVRIICFTDSSLPLAKSEPLRIRLTAAKSVG